MSLKRRIVGIVTSALCLVNIFPGANVSLIAGAESSSDKMQYGDYLFYKQIDEDEDGTYDYVEISNCETSVTEIVIPDKIDGLSVASIGNNAFLGCKSITNIDIPNSVITIGHHAFCNCKSIVNIKIPDGVTTMGDYAFESCESLTNINVSANNKNFSSIDGVLFDKKQKKLIQYPEGKKNTEYIIPDGITSIGNSAFFYCTSLARIDIPDSVSSIGDYAFEFCKSLAGIDIPDSVTSIGIGVFGDTALLKGQTGVKYADTWIVDCDDDVTAVKIKEGTRGIASSVFYNCKSLVSIDMTDSVTSIGDFAFSDCVSLKAIRIPARVTSINMDTFLGCTGLTKIEIPDSVTEIGFGAFSDCTGLVSAEIPGSVKSIGDRAFWECEKLTVYGYENSTAQEYAKKNNIKFELLSKVVQGDADCNGKTNILDAAFIARRVAQRKTDLLPKWADYNNDSKADILDSAAIAKDVAKRILR